MKSHLKYLPFLVLLYITFSCTRVEQENEQEPAAEQADSVITLTQEQIDLAGIKIAKPEKRILSGYVLTNGYIELPPQNLVSIHATASGFVRKVNFLPGDQVKKGQLLCVLEHPDFARLQQSFLETLSQRDYLRKEYERKVTLSKSDATSQKSLQQAEADLKIQDARYKGLKAELNLIGFPAQKIEDTGEIQTSLNIFSPINGLVNQVNINLGKLIQPNDLLYQLMDKTHIHIELKVFSKDLDKIHEGQMIYFKLPDSEETKEAKVHIVSRMVDPANNTSLVHGHLVDHKDIEKLNPGSYINAQIRLGDAEVLSLPRAAVFKEGEKDYVFVRNKESYSLKEITTGIFNEEYIEVQNLNQEDKIVVSGVNYLKGMMSSEP